MTTPRFRLLALDIDGTLLTSARHVSPRVRRALDAARAQGLVGGRKKALTEAKLADAKTLLESGRPPRAVAERLGVSVATLYRHIPAAASIAKPV